MANPSLSTTSYSILGYLAVRPWSAYELTKQMGRTFHHFWPRAESGIYREVKRLVDAGLATADDELVGRRSRTRYDITPLGRQRIAEWLSVPHSDGFLECEGMVRVLFSEHGSKATLQRTLDAMADDARARAELIAEQLRLYLAGAGQFPRRSHINLLIAGFVVDCSVMVDQWSAWAAEIVDTWPDVQERDPDDATLAAMRDIVEQVETVLARPRR